MDGRIAVVDRRLLAVAIFPIGTFGDGLRPLGIRRESSCDASDYEQAHDLAAEELL
jgi:hypothetical protein